MLMRRFLVWTSTLARSSASRPPTMGLLRARMVTGTAQDWMSPPCSIRLASAQVRAWTSPQTSEPEILAVHPAAMTRSCWKITSTARTATAGAPISVVWPPAPTLSSYMPHLTPPCPPVTWRSEALPSPAFLVTAARPWSRAPRGWAFKWR